ncbi:MAG TPA: RHS repeat-associated core domain-containing protein [Longimicrobium sp.]|nr:RHS repeat-associated core domain-containing protein [Longimicrobium sp.]
MQVTPDGGDSLRVSAGASVTARFTVTNTGTGATSFVATAACNAVAGAVCVATRDTIPLAAGESRPVGVLFTASGTVGTVGNVSVTLRRVGDAAVTDAGWTGVRVLAAGSLAQSAQQRPYLDRDDCVTVGLGAGAASECADLRLVNALPPTRTLNQSRAPVLLYNSRHAFPWTIHGTLVTNASGAAWDSVGAVVRRAGVVKATGRWPGWADNATRRIALSFADGISTTAPEAAVYADTMVVSVKSGGAWTQLAVVPINHIVVDRRGSPFGSGWWMAGLERLHLIDGNRILWVGGDGSARVYAPVATGRWASAEPDAPDTITSEAVSVHGGGTIPGFVRHLPGKGQVAFDGLGIHIYTRNRLGHTTWFSYDAAGRLALLGLPAAVPGDLTYHYIFNYNSAAGTLGEVVAPYLAAAGDRRTVLTATGSVGAARVTQITHFPFTADSSTTRYAYDAFGRDTSVTASGTGARTRFQYSNTRVWLASTTALTNGHTDTVTISSGPYELRGIPTVDGATPASNLLYTSWNGPLPGNGDYTTYWFDAAGRVKWVDTPSRRDQVYREDPRYPALVTYSTSTHGVKSTAAYDARGRVTSQTTWNPLGDGRNATTLYTWADPWDELASVTSPTGITTTFGYNAQGLREWQQVGPDPTRRVNYGFNAQGQVNQVRSASAALRGELPEVIGYHPSTGNLVSTTSPLGIQTVSHADRIGRDTLSVAPIDTLRTASGTGGGVLYGYGRTDYHLDGRVRETTSWGQAQYYFSKMDGIWRYTRESVLRTRNGYDAAGRLVKVERWSDPDSAHVGVMTTQYEYDGFGRKTAEIAADGYRETYHYDLAGRDTLTINRLGDPIRMRYDVRGQLLSRAMAGDSSSFTWDSKLGVMLSADNAHARIRRSYYPSGLLKGDTSWVAFEDGSFVAGRHLYGIRHDYDLEGRRTALTLPDSLRPSAAQSQLRYAYDGITGALSQITDPLGNPYTFRYRADGALDTLTAPGGVVQRHVYDADGRLSFRSRGDAFGALYADSLRYDLRGKTVYARSMTGTSEMAYSGLGHLSHSFAVDWSNSQSPESEEEYFHDAVGNKVWHRRTSYRLQAVNTSPVYPTVEYYAPGTARDTATVAAPGVYFAATAPPRQTVLRSFDHAGNLFQTVAVNPVALSFGTTVVAGGRPQTRTNYAEPDGITSSSTVTSTDGQQQVITTYTYRPDGKLTQVQRQSTCIYSLAYYGGCTTQQPAYSEQTRTELFRYDALGRRVRVRTVTKLDTSVPQGGCVFRCDNTTRRTVWDGDHVLAEIRYPTGQGEQDTGLDSTNVAEQANRDARGTTDAGHAYGGRNTSDWAQSGRMLYVHGGGMDQPLGLIRMDYSYDIPGAVAIVPHANWRGTYETASFAGVHCDTVWVPFNEMVYQDSTGKKVAPASVTDENGIERDTTQTRCVEIDFPGKYQGMTRLLRRQTASGPIAWMGSLMQDAQDASGLMFRRNRYYDPSSGRFTQEDPIGLAGGLNSYGFASGDPVNYGDPYGLKDCSTRVGCFFKMLLISDKIGQLDSSVGRFERRVGNWIRSDEGQQTISGVILLAASAGRAGGSGGSARGRTSPTGRLPDEALVCRGGACTADRFREGKGVWIDSKGNLQNASVNSAPGATIEQLTTTIPNNQVGVTTVGSIRSAGGNVVRTPNVRNPEHATMYGITPAKAEELFTPTIRNPHNP